VTATTCPTCGAPVTVEMKALEWPIVRDEKSTLFGTSGGSYPIHTYAPPTLTEAERAVVEASIEFDSIARVGDAGIEYVQTINDKWRAATKALLAARAAQGASDV